MRILLIHIKRDEGIFIGSDSQESAGDCKELQIEKIHRVGNLLFSGAGDSDYIEKEDISNWL